ncbi:MAG: adenylyltransferase, partial [Candidatus Parcubacteria bacterium]|nr:adenylyltransferase [Candidatus Parcubacteria bacterium]
WAFPTNIPIVPGHILVAPVRCVESLRELTAQEKTAILDLISILAKALEQAFQAEGFNYAWNEGELAGQSVPHLHVHVLPRKKGDSGITRYEPRDFLYRPGSREISPDNELLAVAESVRKHL